MNPLVQIIERPIGYSVGIHLMTTRNGIETHGQEKVIPLLVEWDIDGSYRLWDHEAIKQLIFSKIKNYYVGGGSFTQERILEYKSQSLMQGLESYPTLTKDTDGNTHPLEELYLGRIVQLAQSISTIEFLEKLSYTAKLEQIGKSLDLVKKNFLRHEGFALDFHSVPKREVGEIAFIAGKDGIAEIAQPYSFGYQHLIPMDRRCRELSSIKSCEKFLSPWHPEGYKISKHIKDYTTFLRVAIISTKHSMLDGGDLMASSLPKIACKLKRSKIVKNWDNIPEEQRNLQYISYRSGVDLVHKTIIEQDETEINPGAVRLVAPGGVKFAAQFYSDLQAYDSNNKEVDLLLEDETLAKKGALFLYALSDPTFNPKGKTFKDLVDKYKSIQKEEIFLEGKVYKGIILTLQFWRSTQRYTELCKSSAISLDLISKAIGDITPTIPKEIEDDYQKLRSILLTLKEYSIQEVEKEDDI